MIKKYFKMLGLLFYIYIYKSLLISHVTFTPAHIKQAADPLSSNAIAVKDQLNRFWCLPAYCSRVSALRLRG